MASRIRPQVTSLPFAVWTDLALRTSEMLVASAQVIGHRSRRIVLAGHSPGPSDQREFTRMGMEKLEAAGESFWGMGQQLLTTNTQLWTRAWQDAMAAAMAWVAFGNSRTLPQMLQHQLALAHTVSRSAHTVTGLSDAAAHLVGRGLKPIHSRATANARRLGSG